MKMTRARKRSKPKRRTTKRKRVTRRRKLLGRARKTRDRLHKRLRSIAYRAYGTKARVQDLSVGDRVHWKSELSSGEGRVVRFIGTDPASDRFHSSAMLDTGDAITNADHVTKI